VYPESSDSVGSVGGFVTTVREGQDETSERGVVHRWRSRGSDGAAEQVEPGRTSASRDQQWLVHMRAQMRDPYKSMIRQSIPSAQQSSIRAAPLRGSAMSQSSPTASDCCDTQLAWCCGVGQQGAGHGTQVRLHDPRQLAYITRAESD
jgi:hypothetical protein